MSYDLVESTDDGPFWAAAAEGRLTFQRCGSCAFVRWPAAGVCPECLDRGFTWTEVEPTGTVWSYVVYHRAYAGHLKERVPYNVALIQLDCGVRLVSTLVAFEDGVDPMGARVVAQVGAVGENQAVPVFGPA